MRNFEYPDVDYGLRWVHLQPNNLNHRASEPDYEIGLGVQVYLFNSDLRHNNLLLHGSIPQKQYDRLWVLYWCNKGYSTPMIEEKISPTGYIQIVLNDISLPCCTFTVFVNHVTENMNCHQWCLNVICYLVIAIWTTDHATEKINNTMTKEMFVGAMYI